ncbi:MAG: KH domain-containing protein [Actinomycetota bacterium]
MKEILEYIARGIVDEPDSVEVVESVGERGTLLELHVAPDDMGKVIGKGGRTVKAIRNVMKAAAMQQDAFVRVDVVD